jgi:hypothetical protein
LTSINLDIFIQNNLKIPFLFIFEFRLPEIVKMNYLLFCFLQYTNLISRLNLYLVAVICVFLLCILFPLTLMWIYLDVSCLALHILFYQKAAIVFINFSTKTDKDVSSEVFKIIQTRRTIYDSLKVRREKCGDRQKMIYGYLIY